MIRRHLLRLALAGLLVPVFSGAAAGQGVSSQADSAAAAIGAQAPVRARGVAEVRESIAKSLEVPIPAELPPVQGTDMAGELRRISLALVLGSVVALALAGAYLFWRRRSMVRQPELPVLIYPASGPPRPIVFPVPSQPQSAPAMLPPSVARPAPPQPAPALAPAVATPTASWQKQALPVDGDSNGTATVQFNPLGDAPLQLLPGGLEVVDGPERGLEIRFVRLPAPGDPEFTFGRDPGPAYRHIRLEAPTVSRLHARMRFAARRWSIENLSRTNPVLVNDRELTGLEESCALNDGDRIQLGEVILRFREKHL